MSEQSSLQDLLNDAQAFVGKSQCIIGHPVNYVRGNAETGRCIYCKDQFELYQNLGKEFQRLSSEPEVCCFRDCNEPPVAHVQWGAICNTHSYRLAQPHIDDRPVEAWCGFRKVTIYDNSVLRSWGSNIDTEMIDEPRTLSSIQAAFDWLYEQP